MLSKVLEMGFASKHALLSIALHIHEQQFMSVVWSFGDWTFLKSCLYVEACFWHNETRSD